MTVKSRFFEFGVRVFTCALLLNLAMPLMAQAGIREIRREIREGRREVRREQREMRREVRREIIKVIF